MDVLNHIVRNLNKEDLRFYKLFSSRHDMNHDRKDLELLDYIRTTQDGYNEDVIFHKLYKDKDKNGFYSLKNRLIHDISRSLTVQYCYKDDRLYVFHLLFLVRLFFMRNEFSIAKHFLKKAEQEATKMENYEFLDIIYGEYIKLSHELLDINPETYIHKREEARKMSASIFEVDNILSVVYSKMKTSQNFFGKEDQIFKMLEKTINTFGRNKQNSKSPKLRFKIYGAVTQILLQRHEYKTLKTYLLKTYTEFVKDQLFNKETHNVKLEMLHYLANTLFKEKKFHESLHYTDELYNAMKEYDGFLFDKFQFFYYNSQVINYSVLDKDKAIAILNNVLQNKTLNHTPFYEIFVYLNLAELWFEKKEYRTSIKFLNQLYLHNEFKNADVGLKFKIAVAELIIRFELQDLDYLEVKINQVKRQFKSVLNDPANGREKEFLTILRKVMACTNIKKDKLLVKRITNFIVNSESQLNDSEIISYYQWLKLKIQ